MRVILFSSVALCLASSALSAAPVDINAPVTADLAHGTVLRGCSPVDGPAIQLSFPTSGDQMLWLLVNVDLDKPVGRWTVQEDRWTRYGQVQGNVRSGDLRTFGPRVTSGTITVSRSNADSVEGELDLILDGTEAVSGAFKARVLPPRVLPARRLRCG